MENPENILSLNGYDTCWPGAWQALQYPQKIDGLLFKYRHLVRREKRNEIVGIDLTDRW